MTMAEVLSMFECHPGWRLHEVVEPGSELYSTTRCPSGKGLVVENPGTGRVYLVDLSVFADATEEEFAAIIEGEREPDPIYYMTRIVGYYSRTTNWNASKLAEREDRRRGDYALPGHKEQDA